MSLDQPRAADVIDSMVADALAVSIYEYLGLRLVDRKDGEAQLEFEVNAQSGTPAGRLNGGVLSLLLEPAAYIALLPLIPASAIPVTIDFHNQPMRQARLGDRVRLIGRVLRHGRSQAFCEVESRVEGELIAKGLILKALLKVDAR